MKKTKSSNGIQRAKEEMLPEYRFDYTKARPNRFAGRSRSGGREVILDPDVAKVFTTQESVNSVLRALISTMPKRKVH